MIDILTIEGGERLTGEVRVSGAKNSALPLLIASLLSKGKTCLRNVPDLEDISVTLRLLASLGVKVMRSADRIELSTPQITNTEARYGLVKLLRASFWVLGPLVARAGEARVALPGGDAIGTRPVDLHLKGLALLGAQIRMEHGVVIANAPNGLSANTIKLDFPSVGATHHLLLTAALIEGESKIIGAAKEPEILELASMLNQLGAEVSGAGTSEITIIGRSELGDADVEILGDRIEAATYLVAAAATKGKVRVKGIKPEAVISTIDVLKNAGSEVSFVQDSIEIIGPKQLRATSFATMPYPGLATDVQPQLMAAMCVADGQSCIEETIFENRFGHVAEFRRFGAEIEISQRRAIVNGKRSLSAAPVEAGDIRAAAALVIMGLVAEGVSEISGLHHLERGYENLVQKFSNLGAKLSKVPSLEQREVVFGC